MDIAWKLGLTLFSMAGYTSPLTVAAGILGPHFGSRGIEYSWDILEIISRKIASKQEAKGASTYLDPPGQRKKYSVFSEGSKWYNKEKTKDEKKKVGQRKRDIIAEVFLLGSPANDTRLFPNQEDRTKMVQFGDAYHNKVVQSMQYMNKDDFYEMLEELNDHLIDYPHEATEFEKDFKEVKIAFENLNLDQRLRVRESIRKRIRALSKIKIDESLKEAHEVTASWNQAIISVALCCGVTMVVKRTDIALLLIKKFTPQAILNIFSSDFFGGSTLTDDVNSISSYVRHHDKTALDSFVKNISMQNSTEKKVSWIENTFGENRASKKKSSVGIGTYLVQSTASLFVFTIQVFLSLPGSTQLVTLATGAFATAALLKKAKKGLRGFFSSGGQRNQIAMLQTDIGEGLVHLAGNRVRQGKARADTLNDDADFLGQAGRQVDEGAAVSDKADQIREKTIREMNQNLEARGSGEARGSDNFPDFDEEYYDDFNQ